MQKMGSGSSIDLSQYVQYQKSYFAVDLAHSNSLKLILAPEEIVEDTQMILSEIWPVRKVKKSPGYVVFKLTGSPWRAHAENNLLVKHLICSLLTKFYVHGWHLKTALDLQRTTCDTNVLFFHKEKPTQTSLLCLSLNSTDLIRILSPVSIIPILKQTILDTWPQGILGEQIFGKGFEIRLNGNPWSSECNQTVGMMCELINILFKNGWLFVGSIKSAKSANSLNALYFRYAPEEVSDEEKERAQFFALSFNKTDRIRLHRVTPELISIMKNPRLGIGKLWKQGIQRVKINEDVLEFKLIGNPWQSFGSETIESKLLVNEIFKLLFKNSWHFYAVCDLSRNSSNKSTFFFRNKEENTSKTPVNFCVSFCQGNKIRLIETDLYVDDEVRSAVNDVWPDGIVNESEYFEAWQFKLTGKPFSSLSVAEHVQACVMMLFILFNVEKIGHKFLCSADTNGKFYVTTRGQINRTIDLYNWFFEK